MPGILGMSLIAARAACLLFVLLAAGPFGGYHEEEAQTGKLYWRAWPEADRREILEILPRSLAAIEARLSRKLGVPFTTVLVPDGAELLRVARDLLDGGEPPHEDIVGLAIPSRRVLIVKAGLIPGLDRAPGTLIHEVAHLVIHRDLSARIPRWFDEGVASWIAEPVLPPGEEARLSLLARVGAIYSLKRLDWGFPGGHVPVSTAYQQSLLFIRFLVEGHSDGVVPHLLDRFEAGEWTDSAIRSVTGRTREEVEEAFRVWLSRRVSLWRAVASVVSLWSLVGLLALVAIARYVLTRRRRMEALGSGELPETTEVLEKGQDRESA
jgi:hypothetical protein